MTERVGKIPGNHLFQVSSFIGEETEAERGRDAVTKVTLVQWQSWDLNLCLMVLVHGSLQ